MSESDFAEGLIETSLEALTGDETRGFKTSSVSGEAGQTWREMAVNFAYEVSLSYL
jgi:hypothetical protein